MANNIGWNKFRLGTTQYTPQAAARAAADAAKGLDVMRERAIHMKEWLEKFIVSLPKSAR